MIDIIVNQIMKEKVEHENKLATDFIVECIMDGVEVDGVEASDGRTLKIPNGLINTYVYTFSSEYLSKEIVNPKNANHLKEIIDACQKKVDMEVEKASKVKFNGRNGFDHYENSLRINRLLDFINDHKPKISVGVDKAEEGDSISVAVKSGVDAINEMINTKILDMGKRDATKKLVSALNNIITTPEKTVEDDKKPCWGKIELWKMPAFDYVLPKRNDEGLWSDGELSRCFWNGIPNSINDKHEEENTRNQKHMNNKNSFIETVNDTKYKNLQTKLLESYNKEEVVDLSFKESNGKKYVEFRLKTSPSKRHVAYKNNLDTINGALELLTQLETLIIKNRDDIFRIKMGMHTVYNGEELKFNEIINDQSFFFAGLYVKFDNGAVLPYDMLVNQEFKYKL